MRIVLLILITLHGSLHALGFIKAFKLLPVHRLTGNISKVNGAFWLISAVLFIVSGFLIYQTKDWWIVLLIATLVSQYLIFTSWHNARFGTIANIVLLMAVVIGLGTWSFTRAYHNEISEARKHNSIDKSELLTEVEIQHLPNPIKKYLHYTRAVGKPKVQNFKVEFTGEFRQNEKAGWMPFASQQVNFMERPTRLFFMDAVMKHVPVAGFHCYKNAKASMDIRLLSLFKVQYQAGARMDTTETVTFFNDMCVMAPSTLIDKRIKWLHTEGNTVSAEFTNDKISILAELLFNDKGELINFISDNRYALRKDNSLTKTRWSTPLNDYKESNGYRLASYGETIYSFPEGDFCYGKFKLKKIDYNVKE